MVLNFVTKPIHFYYYGFILWCYIVFSSGSFMVLFLTLNSNPSTWFIVQDVGI